MCVWTAFCTDEDVKRGLEITLGALSIRSAPVWGVFYLGARWRPTKQKKYAEEDGKHPFEDGRGTEGDI